MSETIDRIMDVVNDNLLIDNEMADDFMYWNLPSVFEGQYHGELPTVLIKGSEPHTLYKLEYDHMDRVKRIYVMFNMDPTQVNEYQYTYFDNDDLQSIILPSGLEFILDYSDYFDITWYVDGSRIVMSHDLNTRVKVYNTGATDFETIEV